MSLGKRFPSKAFLISGTPSLHDLRKLQTRLSPGQKLEEETNSDSDGPALQIVLLVLEASVKYQLHQIWPIALESIGGG